MSNDEKIEEEIENNTSEANVEETTDAESKNDEEIKLDDETVFKSDNVQAKTDKLTTKNKIIIIIGYIFALLIPLIGLIYGIILAYINKPHSYREHGVYIIILSIIMWIIYFIIGLA